jgi:hypothetical protein
MRAFVGRITPYAEMTTAIGKDDVSAVSFDTLTAMVSLSKDMALATMRRVGATAYQP